MKIYIENVSLLKGEELELVENADLVIKDSKIDAIESGRGGADTVVEGSELFAIPGLINAHVHIGDSIAKDIGVGKSLEELVKPVHGLKTKILDESPYEQLRRAIRLTLGLMTRNGVTAFADFREGGAAGVNLLQGALDDGHPRALVMARPNYYCDEKTAEDTGFPPEALEELRPFLPKCHGIGLSGTNEYTDSALEEVYSLAATHQKLLAIHAAESRATVEFSWDRFGRSEVERAYDYLRPSLLVHLTNSSAKDRKMVIEHGTPVCCCPRTNALLGVGIPPIREFLEEGLVVALGTDNVMLNSPDLFREMDFTSKVIRAIEREPSAISPIEVLKMTTVNAAKALRMEDKIGSISTGKLADIVFLDKKSPNMSPTHDPVAAIIHRACSSDIRAVMIGGKVVYGKLQAVAG